MAGPPTVHDRVRGRRTGNLDDYITLVKLAQCFDVIHFVGNQPTSPQELPANTRHLDSYLANLTYTDRTFHCLAIGRERTLDGIQMMAISRGLTLEDVVDDPCVLTIISVNSPRRFDEAMTDGLMTMAEHGQPAVITPFTLMGAMTPVTLAAALVQQNAEALAGITLTQLVRPGAPVVYGAFTSNVDLRSGAPAFGTPENARATLAAGQLARRYRIPYRASNASASNALDAQAAYESQMSIWSAVLGGAHLVYHGAGWMEGGLTASFEKIVLDVEMLQMIAATIAPAAITEAEIARGARRDRRRPDRRSLLRLATHPGPLRDGVLRATRLELAELRGLGGKRFASRPTSGPRVSGRRRSSGTSSRRSKLRSRSASPRSWRAARSSSATSSTDEPEPAARCASCSSSPVSKRDTRQVTLGHPSLDQGPGQRGLVSKTPRGSKPPARPTSDPPVTRSLGVRSLCGSLVWVFSAL